MSQSASLYRIVQEDFKILELANGKNLSSIDLTDNYVTFQGTFMALEYLLSKDQDEINKKRISEIFNPTNTLGYPDLGEKNYTEYTEEEIDAIINTVRYITPETVSDINTILINIDQMTLDRIYNSEELNKNGIYPGIWHNDNSIDLAFNKRDLSDDLLALKNFFLKATQENNYVLCFVG